MPLTFLTVIQIISINPYVLVSAARAKKIRPEGKKPIPVLVRVNGEPKEKPWRINMMPVGDSDFYLYLHGIVRKASGTKVGDKVHVEIEFDDEYRNGPQHAMSPWFRDPLLKNVEAKKGWDALSPSRRKEILRNFARLKSPEARTRNLEKALHVLAGKGDRFMARDW